MIGWKDKFDKTLARFVKELIQINKIIGEKGDVTIDTTKIQRNSKGYHEQLHTNKLDHQKQMEKFLKICNLLTMYQEEKENVNRLNISKEILSVIRDLSTKESQKPDGSLVNCTKHLRNY